jgi:hypothetical protein
MLSVAETSLGTPHQLSPLVLDLVTRRTGEARDRGGLPVDAPKVRLRALECDINAEQCEAVHECTADIVVYLENGLSTRRKRDAVGQFLCMEDRASSCWTTDDVDPFAGASPGIQVRRILIVSERDRPGFPTEQAQRGNPSGLPQEAAGQSFIIRHVPGPCIPAGIDEAPDGAHSPAHPLTRGAPTMPRLHFPINSTTFCTSRTAINSPFSLIFATACDTFNFELYRR